MKNIVLTNEAHMVAAECEGIEFERGVPQLVDDTRAEIILRHPWFAEALDDAPPEKPADKPAALAVRAPEPPSLPSEPAK